MHRNSQKRYYDDNYIYFIVTKAWQNYPYFAEEMFGEILIEELRICKKLKQFKLYAFCLIYDHLHLLIQPGKKFNVSKIIHFIKKNASNNINKIMGFNEFESKYEGEFAQIRLRMDEFTNSCRKKFIQKYNENQFEMPKFKWQKSYHDHIIRNRQDYYRHYNYTVFNYQKHGLPDDWKYTSLNYEDMIDELTDDKPFEWRPFIKH